MIEFPFDEKYLSQIPAMQLLINLGYECLTPEEALRERQGRYGNVLLERILREQLKRINRITHKGGEYLFTEENIQTAIQRLKNVKFEGLQRTNEAIYDLLTLGVSLEQAIDGDSKSFNLSYIDWRNWERNRFHVVAEFGVARSRSAETIWPDIVLFVNGIPLGVIECKAPSVELEQAVSQVIRNQHDDFIPRLFTFAQLVLAVNKNGAQFATAGTPVKFWSVWKERGNISNAVSERVNAPLSKKAKASLFRGVFAMARAHFDTDRHGLARMNTDTGERGERIATEQDMAIYSLCRPERLLELAYKFTVFDGGIKKIARYHQYFVIKSALERIRQFDSQGRHRGGNHLAYARIGEITNHGDADARLGARAESPQSEDCASDRPRRSGQAAWEHLRRL